MPALFSSTSDRAAYAFARLEVTAASTSKIVLRFFFDRGFVGFRCRHNLFPHYAYFLEIWLTETLPSEGRNSGPVTQHALDRKTSLFTLVLAEGFERPQDTALVSIEVSILPTHLIHHSHYRSLLSCNVASGGSSVLIDESYPLKSAI